MPKNPPALLPPKVKLDPHSTPSNPASTPGPTSSPVKIQPNSKPLPNNSSSTTAPPTPFSSRSSTPSSPPSGSSGASAASKPSSGITRSNASTRTSHAPNSSTSPFSTIPLWVTPTRMPSSRLPAFSGVSMVPTACSSVPSKPSRTSRPRLRHPRQPSPPPRSLTHRFPNRHPPWQLNHLSRQLGSFRQLLLHLGNGRM